MSLIVPPSHEDRVRLAMKTYLFHYAIQCEFESHYEDDRFEVPSKKELEVWYRLKCRADREREALIKTLHIP